ncbi:hypothetical protein EYF80_058383 [Liparis tanakae]|uniref:Secreted protein n=1 Tax=Liparis tanakae TaxID=230148 RepID=A0A4Z2ERK3_9TELE|nr:hypothetical protein EYF80_058383 [Liparis tanakae]
MSTLVHLLIVKVILVGVVTHRDFLPPPSPLHADPGGVEDAHQPQHPLQDVPDDVGRHAERADLRQSFGPDVPHGALRFIDQRLEGWREQGIKGRTALQETRQRQPKGTRGGVGLLLLGPQQLALSGRSLLQLVHQGFGLVQLGHAGLQRDERHNT